jgi:ABC-type glycerol-3-phosphate transport system permease component
MLHTRENMTLQVGLVALQGAFANDARHRRGVVMTIIPIIIFSLCCRNNSCAV